MTNNTAIPFQIDAFGLYSIAITARCDAGQTFRVEIDDLKLREVPAESNIQYDKIPSTWNGNELKGLSKTGAVFVKQIDDFLFYKKPQ